MNQPSSLNRFRILIFLGEYAEFGCSDIMITPSRYLFFLSCFSLSCSLSVLVRMVRIMMGGGSGRIIFRVFF